MKKNPQQNVNNPLHVYNTKSGFFEFRELNAFYMICYVTINKTYNYAQANFISPEKMYTQYYDYNKSVSEYESHPLHRHDFYEVMYVLEGTVTQNIEGKIYTYSSGDCCVMNRNIRHRESYSSNYRAIFLMISEKFIHDIFYDDFAGLSDEDRCRLQLLQMIEENKQKKYYCVKEFVNYFFKPPGGSQKDNMYEIWDEIVLETVNKTPGYLLIVRGLLLRFFLQLEMPLLYRSEKYHLEGKNSEELFSKIVRFLEGNDGRFSREEMEESLGYSSNYLNRIVKKYTGMNLIKFGQAFCLKKAGDLLDTTDMSISEIIDFLGFSNRHYFYNIFKEKYGITPKEYRNRRG